MGKYSDLTSDIFSVFASNAWVAENIKVVPSDFVGGGETHVRATAVASGKSANRASVSGILILEIFTSAGAGPKEANTIADKLDTYLENQSLQTTSGGLTQFGTSSMADTGRDRHNSSLSTSRYEIPFNFFGVI
jgi:hypothetical protein